MHRLLTITLFSLDFDSEFPFTSPIFFIEADGGVGLGKADETPASGLGLGLALLSTKFLVLVSLKLSFLTKTKGSRHHNNNYIKL